MTANCTVHEYLLTQEAADLLRCSARTLARMRADGSGPRYHKRRNRILYPRALIEEWVAQNTITPVRSDT